MCKGEWGGGWGRATCFGLDTETTWFWVACGARCQIRSNCSVWVLFSGADQSENILRIGIHSGLAVAALRLVRLRSCISLFVGNDRNPDTHFLDVLWGL